MPNERVVEIPWALLHLPQTGRILDVGSCDATYLMDIQTLDRHVECLDPRDCSGSVPPGLPFHRSSLFGNTLPRNGFDAVLLLSVLEHLGLPTYGQRPVRHGDLRAIAECWSLLRRDGVLVVTVPAGRAKVASWYRQYTPELLDTLFAGWRYDVTYWGMVDGRYVEVSRNDVAGFDYRDRFDRRGGAGAIAGVVATRP